MGKKHKHGERPLEIEWEERHRNGSTIKIYGEAARVVSIIGDWRAYQETKDGARRTAGFSNV